MRLFDRAVVRVLPAVPRSVVRRVASQYIAGRTLDDARRVVAALNAEIDRLAGSGEIREHHLDPRFMNVHRSSPAARALAEPSANDAWKSPAL